MKKKQTGVKLMFAPLSMMSKKTVEAMTPAD